MVPQDYGWFLPVKAAVRRAEGLVEGGEAEVELEMEIEERARSDELELLTGVAAHQRGEDASAWIARADKALYLGELPATGLHRHAAPVLLLGLSGRLAIERPGGWRESGG